MTAPVETPALLDALPVGTIVLGDDGHPWRMVWKNDEGGTIWATEGRHVSFPSTAAGLLPATVLYRPDAPAGLADAVRAYVDETFPESDLLHPALRRHTHRALLLAILDAHDPPKEDGR